MDENNSKKWTRNLTNIDKGIFRTMNGNADEMIAIGRVIKAGFSCSRVDVTNSKYDAIVDISGCKKLLRIQIKGTGTQSIDFTGGGRSGQQIRKDAGAPNRTYKYTEKDCDLIIGVDTCNGECYIIPITDIAQWKNNAPFAKLQQYRENWQLLINIAKTIENKD